MARLCVANNCIPKLLLQSNWITGSLLLMVPGAEILPWKGTRSLPVTEKWKCYRWVEDREPNQCLHREAATWVSWWLTRLGCQLRQHSALHARLFGEKNMFWLGLWDRVCHEGMSADLEEGCCKGRVGLQRTLKSWGYGVTEQGSQPNLDPMAAWALQLPKQLVWNAGVQNEGAGTWGQRARNVAPLSVQPCLSGPCSTAE